MYGELKKTDFQVPSEDVSKIAESILKNDNLCKLLYFTDNIPYSHTITAEQKAEIFEKRMIEIVPRIQASTELHNYLVISFDEFSANFTNQTKMDATITIDVICPLSMWRMEDVKGQTVLRPYELCHEVHGIMNGKKLTGIGTCQFINASAIMIPANEDIGGFSMHYQVINDDNNGYKNR